MKTFFQQNWKGIMIIGLVIALILLLFPNLTAIKKQAAQQTKTVIDKKIDLSDVQQWKDKFNTLHLKLEKIQVEKEVLQVYSDSIAKVLKIKSKNIQSITQIKSGISIDQKLDVQNLTFTNNLGSQVINYTSFSYSDKWINIKGDTGKTDSIHVKGTDTLTKIDYTKRKWLFGKKHYYSDFSNKNPHIIIEGLKQVEVKPTINRWGIGPSIGVSARLGDKLEIAPIIGISLQYNFITF